MAFDGLQALETVMKDRPSAIDIGLPGLDGYQVARKLRERGMQCPIIAVTGYDDTKKCLEAGFDRHLVKPLSIPTLNEILKSLDDVGLHRIGG